MSREWLCRCDFVEGALGIIGEVAEPLMVSLE